MKIALTNQQKKELRLALQDKRLSWRLRKRLEVIRMVDDQRPLVQISRYLEITPVSVTRYILCFQKGGVAALLQKRKPGNAPKITEQHLLALRREQVKKRKNGECWTGKQMAAWLKKTYGLTVNVEWLMQRLRQSTKTEEEGSAA